MTKAMSIHAGDWIRVDGKTVEVTKTKRHGNGEVHISYKGRSKSGMLRPDLDSDVVRVYGRGWKW